MFDWLIPVLHLIAYVLIAFPLIAMLFITAFTIAAVFPGRRNPEATKNNRIAVIIPAHNESLLIGETVEVALRQNYPEDAYCVFVIADNCTDDTAEIARKAGARVLERDSNPGKGQGLNDALAILLKEDWEGFLIMDADSHLTSDALGEINKHIDAGHGAYLIRYGTLNPADSVRTRLFEMSLASFNALRPKGKTQLGFSAGINGNGFGFSRAIIEEVPYSAHSIVEDIEYHMLLLNAGHRVHFLDGPAVMAQMPTNAKDSEVQRVRWERGRALTIKNYAGSMWRLFFKGSRRGLDGLVDIYMPPASLIVITSVIAMLLGDELVMWIGGGIIGALILHYLIASLKYGSFAGLVRIAFYVPWYLIWKTWIVAASFVKDKNLPWIRTNRH